MPISHKKKVGASSTKNKEWYRVNWLPEYVVHWDLDSLSNVQKDLKRRVKLASLNNQFLIIKLDNFILIKEENLKQIWHSTLQSTSNNSKNMIHSIPEVQLPAELEVLLIHNFEQPTKSSKKAGRTIIDKTKSSLAYKIAKENLSLVDPSQASLLNTTQDNSSDFFQTPSLVLESLNENPAQFNSSPAPETDATTDQSLLIEDFTFEPDIYLNTLLTFTPPLNTPEISQLNGLPSNRDLQTHSDNTLLSKYVEENHDLQNASLQLNPRNDQPLSLEAKKRKKTNKQYKYDLDAKIWYQVDWIPGYVVYRDPDRDPSILTKKPYSATMSNVFSALTGIKSALNENFLILKLNHFTLIEADNLNKLAPYTLKRDRTQVVFHDYKFHEISENKLPIEFERTLVFDILNFNPRAHRKNIKLIQAIKNSDAFKLVSEKISSGENQQSEISTVSPNVLFVNDTEVVWNNIEFPQIQELDSYPITETTFTEFVPLEDSSKVDELQKTTMEISEQPNVIAKNNQTELLCYSLFGAFNQSMDKYTQKIKDKFDNLNVRVNQVESKVSAFKNFYEENKDSNSERSSKRLRI